jgi:hypothetical protein
VSSGAGTASDSRGDVQRDARPVLTLVWVLCWFSAIYLPTTAIVAARRYLWNDELFTFYISAQPMRRIWTVLLTGVDQQPPPFHWLTHELLRILGPSPLTVRLPELAGFWLFGACVIIIVSRRLPPAYGFLGAMLAAVSGAYPYAYEARPYAIVLGLSALAFLCWQRLDDGKGFAWLMAASLALGLCMHYYAILVLVPFAAAELVHWHSARRIRWRSWIAMAGASAPLLAWLPVIRAAGNQQGDFWARPDFFSLPNYFSIILAPAALPFAVVGICGAGAAVLRRPKDAARVPVVPVAEIAAAIGFATIPLLAALMAALATGAFTPRYALPGVMGICLLGAWALAWAFRARSRPATLAGIFLSCYFVANTVAGFDSTKNAANRAAVVWMIEHYASERLPVAIADPHMFLELSYQAPPGLRNRFFYIADPKAAALFLKTGIVDRQVIGMQPWAELRVRRLEDVLSAGLPFLVFGYPGPWAWLVPELSSRKIPMSVAGILGPDVLLRAAPNGSAAFERK